MSEEYEYVYRYTPARSYEIIVDIFIKRMCLSNLFVKNDQM